MAVLALVVPMTTAAPVTVAAAPTAPVTPAVASRAPLTPRLQELARPAFRALPRTSQAERLSLPAAGPGSILVDASGVLVDIRLSDVASPTLAAVAAVGAVAVSLDRDRLLLTARVLPSALSALAAVPQVLAVMEVLRPLSRATCPTGVLSEGNTQLKAGTARTTYTVDGTGLTVGVLSDSYNSKLGAATDVTNAELPGTTNPCGYPHAVGVQADQAGSDEGRAMSQIVHDLAPGADIRFATAFVSETDFATQIRNLATAGAKVIVDDVSYFDEPMYQDGVVGKAVEDVVAGGASYFSSAGNENVQIGTRDVGSYESQAFRPATCPAAVVTAEGGVAGLQCHDFDGGAGVDATYGLTLTVPAGGSASFVFGWNEPQSGIATDLDLFLLNAAGTVVAASSNERNVTTQRAFEYLSTKTSGSYSLVVARRSGAGTPRFKVIDMGGDTTGVEYGAVSGGDVVGPTTFGHNASRSGATVAAVRFDNAAKPEYFSSRGPATYCWGPVVGSVAAAALSPCQTATVDVSATDGGANSFFGQQGYGGASDLTWRFFGTSAAAPHAAAIAALVRQYRPCLTPAQVLQTMKSSSVAVGAYGADAVGGGLLDATAALTAAKALSCLPAVTVTFPSANAAGWYTASPVTGTVTATDSDTIASVACTGATVGTVSGLGTKTATAPLSVSAQGTSAVSCTAKDGLGGTGADPASTSTASIKLDSVAPAVVVRPAGNACTVTGSSGWCRGTQTAGFGASDATSGLANVAKASFTASTSTNGAAVSIPSGAVVDVAGNSSAGVSATGFKVDSAAPAVSLNAAGNSCTIPGLLGWCRGSQSAAFTSSDATSGLADVAKASFTASTSTNGAAVSIPSGAVVDVAGNSSAGATATGFKVDSVAPVVSLRPAGDSCTVVGLLGWCRGSQSAGFASSDVTSGLADPAKASFTASTSTNGAAVSIPSGVVVDVAGNSATGVTASGFKVDTVAPVVVHNAAADSCDLPVQGGCGGTQTAGFTSSDVTSGLANPVLASFTVSTSTNGPAVTIVSGSVTDAAGNTSAGASAGPYQIDTTPPTVVHVAAGDTCSVTGLSGWCRGVQRAAFAASDEGFGVPLALQSFLVDASGEGAAVIIPSGPVTDLAGRTNPGIDAGPYKIDSTAPVVTLRPAGDSCSRPGNGGWCRGTVTAGFAASDATSGLSDPTKAAFTMTTAANGAAVMVGSGVVSDVAGTAAAPVSAGPWQVDYLPPAVSLLGVRARTTYVAGATPAASCRTTDSVSGVAAAAVLRRVGAVTGLGAVSATCTGAVDAAGNPGSSVAVAYRVVAATTGFVAPRSGSAVRRGRVLAVSVPLTTSNGRALLDATSARLAAGRSVRVVLHARTATGSIRALAPCAYSRTLHRFGCSLRLPASLALGSAWLEVQENVGVGFVRVPRTASGRTSNPLRVLVVR